jgi:ubiquinone/menaquinone biosynthesis C-methylase UbiE
MSATRAYDARFKNTATAQSYADRFERPTHRHINRREQRAVAKILSQLDGVNSILDMPAGAGRFLPTLKSGNRTIFEIDVSHEMLQLSHQRLAGDKKIHWVQGDAFHLPLADGMVDCLFCNRLLHHFKSAEDRLKLLKEMSRITGRYVIVSFFDYHRFGKVRVFLKRLRGRRPDYSGHPTKAAFESEVAQAGFKVNLMVPTGPPWVAQVYYLLQKK